MHPTDARRIRGEEALPAADIERPGNPAVMEWAAAGLEAPDKEVIREWRLSRLRSELARRDLAGAVLLDPINVRYATDTSNMQIFCMHNMVRYVFIATHGPVVLFDFPGCGHLSRGLSRIDEVRDAMPMSFFDAGPSEPEFVDGWARTIDELLREHGGRDRRVAIDRMPPGGAQALAHHGVESVDGYGLTEHARSIKHPEEIKAMRRSIHAAETGMWRMWEALEPGRTTENELWSWLHQANIARGGEWIETRLLASGPRTNPWFQECSDRVIQPDELVTFDTDLVGPYGICADVSRAWVAGDRATPEQETLHALALEHIEHNAALIRPGCSFHELGDRSHRLPADCRTNRYPTLVHGIGLCDEYPSIRYPEDRDDAYDGILEAGMTVCVEAYLGRDHGGEGVKVERQGVITEAGIEFLDRFPLGLFPEYPGSE